MAVLGLSGILAQEQEPSIELIVITEDGTPIPRAYFKVKNHGGEVEAQGEVIDGRAEILDMGIGPHSILVGCHACAPVELKGIFFYGGGRQVYWVMLSSYQNGLGQAGAGCGVLVRVRDGEDRPLHPAQLVDIGFRELYVTDRYGRIRLIVGKGRTKRMLLYTARNPACELELRCGQRGRIEREVIAGSDGCSVTKFDRMVWRPGIDDVPPDQ